MNNQDSPHIRFCDIEALYRRVLETLTDALEAGDMRCAADLVRAWRACHRQADYRNLLDLVARKPDGSETRKV